MATWIDRKELLKFNINDDILNNVIIKDFIVEPGDGYSIMKIYESYKKCPYCYILMKKLDHGLNTKLHVFKCIQNHGIWFSNANTDDIKLLFGMNFG